MNETEWIERTLPAGELRGLEEGLGVSPFLARLLLGRGVRTAGEARSFFDAPLSELPQPRDMKDLSRAVDLAWDAVRAGTKVVVFGDYDVDGICSAALLTHGLRALGAQVETLLASRFDYGYGMGPKQAGAVASTGARLAILVDCGTSDLEAAAVLGDRGIAAIVIDHHRVGPRHPPVSAFVNPMRADCPFPCKSLTASGLSFYFVAMMTRLAPAWAADRAGKIDARDYLDLAAIGTVADVAPVTGANRCILKAGLRRMQDPSRPAVARMLAAAGLTRRTRSEEMVSFHIAPVLNSAGRMGDPALALRFMLAEGEEEARTLHEKIALLNERRRGEEQRVTQEAVLALTKKDLPGRASVVLAGKGWHPGVLGIVASRLVERTGRIVAVVGIEGATGRGSIRVPEGADIFSALERSRDLFERFGGHSAAVGFTLRADRLKMLEEKLEEAGRTLLARGRSLVIDATVPLEEAGWPHVEDIERLAPFGRDNPQPLVCLDGVSVRDAKIVGSDHLRFFAAGKTGGLPVFGPHMGGHLRTVAAARRLAGHLRQDTYRGGRAVEFVLKDFK
jgi:single-stranded-DNA-specific exonuclease